MTNSCSKVIVCVTDTDLCVGDISTVLGVLQQVPLAFRSISRHDNGHTIENILPLINEVVAYPVVVYSNTIDCLKLRYNIIRQHHLAISVQDAGSVRDVLLAKGIKVDFGSLTGSSIQGRIVSASATLVESVPDIYAIFGLNAPITVPQYSSARFERSVYDSSLDSLPRLVGTKFTQEVLITGKDIASSTDFAEIIDGKVSLRRGNKVVLGTALGFAKDELDSLR